MYAVRAIYYILQPQKYKNISYFLKYLTHATKNAVRLASQPFNRRVTAPGTKKLLDTGNPAQKVTLQWPLYTKLI